MGMLYHWTKECDLGIAEIRYDRKALQGTLKKYIATVSKLPAVLSRGAWRTLEDPMLPIHKNRLECMVTVCSLTASNRLYIYIYIYIYQGSGKPEK